jgi:hypothetical protein
LGRRYWLSRWVRKPFPGQELGNLLGCFFSALLHPINQAGHRGSGHCSEQVIGQGNPRTVWHLRTRQKGHYLAVVEVVEGVQQLVERERDRGTIGVEFR